MKQTQLEKLQQLQADLTDVFLDEADPKNWPGYGLKSTEMGQKDRGDRYWSKKNAVATLAIICRIQTLTTPSGTPPAGSSSDDDSDLDKQRKDAEKEATALLDRLHGGKAPKASKKANAK